MKSFKRAVDLALRLGWIHHSFVFIFLLDFRYKQEILQLIDQFQYFLRISLQCRSLLSIFKIQINNNCSNSLARIVYNDGWNKTLNNFHCVINNLPINEDSFNYKTKQLELLTIILLKLFCHKLLVKHKIKWSTKFSLASMRVLSLIENYSCHVTSIPAIIDSIWGHNVIENSKKVFIVIEMWTVFGGKRTLLLISKYSMK